MDDGPLVAETRIDRFGRNIGFPGNCGNRRGAPAVLAEQAFGGIEHRLSGCFRLLLALPRAVGTFWLDVVHIWVQ
ncbi:hypothetical protein D3C87_2140290 [compost metagenome]